MACIVITVSSPYHYAMKARKPQSPKRESAAISGMGVCKRIAIAHCGAFLLLPPSFPLRASTPCPPCPSQLLLLPARAITPIAPTRMTGRIYRWTYTQELFVTSQATYG